jgi:hypothetical protein
VTNAFDNHARVLVAQQNREMGFTVMVFSQSTKVRAVQASTRRPGSEVLIL